MPGRNRSEQIGGFDSRLDQSESPDIGVRVLLRLDEVARLCGVSIKTIRRWIDGEGLPVVRIAGAGARLMTFVAPHDLDEWIDKRRRIAAQDQDDTQTVRLHGRRFIKTDATNGNKSARRP